jgi:AcrR family transcriptional regulator
MQRSRLLTAAVAVIDGLGWSDATVTHIAGRARVSRRTFYELFSDREDCLRAVLEYTMEQVATELEAADVGALPWRERVRTGLWIVLCFLDREPALARLCVVQSARGNSEVLELREGIFARLGAVIDEGRLEGARAAQAPPLTAEILVGGVLAILSTRLCSPGWGVADRPGMGEAASPAARAGRSQAIGGASDRGPRPVEERPAPPSAALSGLLGELMSLIVLPYLGPGVARRERARPTPSISASVSSGASGGIGVTVDERLRDIPMRLTYRTALVLEAVAEHPGISNRVVSEYAGISDQGQVSKLLARLERIGLLANTGEGQAKGERNAWQLTPVGHGVTQSIRTRTRHPQRAA